MSLNSVLIINSLRLLSYMEFIFNVILNNVYMKNLCIINLHSAVIYFKRKVNPYQYKHRI